MLYFCAGNTRFARHVIFLFIASKKSEEKRKIFWTVQVKLHMDFPFDMSGGFSPTAIESKAKQNKFDSFLFCACVRESMYSW